MSNLSAILLILLVGFGAGIMSGLFGIGGGLVIVPALVIIFGFTQKQATGTSLFALLLPVGLLAVWEYAQQGNMRWKHGLLIAPGLLVGGLIGAKITRGMSDLTLKRVYAGFLLIVACYYLLISTERGRAFVFSSRAKDTNRGQITHSQAPSDLS